MRPGCFVVIEEEEKMEILTGDKIRTELINLIEDANKMLVIISPYISLEKMGEWEDIVKKLKEKADKRLFLEIHIRKDYYDIREKKNKEKTKEEVENIFKGISLDNIYTHEKLHAKLYFNEKTALVTSMNLWGSSMDKNIELGYLLRNSEYEEVRKKFYEEYLVMPNEIIDKGINNLNAMLNKGFEEKKYFSAKFLQNKIHIKNNKFTIKCFLEQWMDRSDYQNSEMIEIAIAGGYDPEKDERLEPHNKYLLKFEIVFIDDISYSKVEKRFYDILKDYRFPINYEEHKEQKTIIFSSDFISEYRQNKLGNKPIELVLHSGDIRNVFFSAEFEEEFGKYMEHIVITLRKILYP